MSAVLLAEFAQVERLLAAARRIDRASVRVLDAFTPFPVPQLDELLAQDRSGSRIVRAMLVGGLSFAAIAFALQWYSAVVNYPLNVGGRPLDSWPVFLLVPFEVGMLAATVSGFVVFLIECGLPRLHDPVFALPGFERASQDRFFLLVETAAATVTEVRGLLLQAGALLVSEVRP